MVLGERIREERKKRGLSQNVVAHNAGIAVNSLRLYEANKRTPNLEQLRRIAIAIGVTVADLVDNEYWATLPDYETKTAFSDNPLKTTLESLFQKLNEEGQQKAVERVEELTEIPKYQK